MKKFFLLISTICLFSCDPEEGKSQKMEVVKFDALEQLMTKDSDKIEVINFWATWCKPCIAEIPYFQAIHEQNENVKVTLVSLDFADQFEKKVRPFVKENGLTADILLLDNLDYNSWIDRVDPSWSGAIPATLVINHTTGERIFLEKEMEKGEIEQIVNDLTD